MFESKKTLIQKAFEEAEKELPKASKSMLAVYLSSVLEEKFNYKKDERTFVRYYTNLVENNSDYKIDDLTLDFISKFLGFKSFKEFCTEIDVPNDNTQSVLEEILHNLVIIKDSISLVVHNFSLKKSGFGIVGLVFVLGLVLNKFNFFKGNEKANISNQSDTGFLVKKNENSPIVIPQQIVYIPQEIKEISKNNISTEAKKQCMYWNGEFYVEIFCNELIEGKEIIALSEEKKLLKKITRPDTLTVENALGKVWYDKSNNKVEFFTHYGKHPENGKALKDVSETILEKYAKK